MDFFQWQREISLIYDFLWMLELFHPFILSYFRQMTKVDATTTTMTTCIDKERKLEALHTQKKREERTHRVVINLRNQYESKN